MQFSLETINWENFYNIFDSNNDLFYQFQNFDGEAPSNPFNFSQQPKIFHTLNQTTIPTPLQTKEIVTISQPSDNTSSVIDVSTPIFHSPPPSNIKHKLPLQSLEESVVEEPPLKKRRSKNNQTIQKIIELGQKLENFVTVFQIANPSTKLSSFETFEKEFIISNGNNYPPVALYQKRIEEIVKVVTQEALSLENLRWRAELKNQTLETINKQLVYKNKILETKIKELESQNHPRNNSNKRQH